MFEGFELANIDKQTWLKGLMIFTHQDWHNITELEFDPNGEINLNGRVQGRSRTPYTQFITLHPEYTTQRGHIARWHVNGNCSYPVGCN